VTWYTDRGQRAMINAPMPLAAPVNSALDDRGWTARPLTLVQTAPLAVVLGALPARGDLPPVALADTPADDWYAMVAEHKGALPGSARRILTGVPESVFAMVRDDRGELLAVARGTVTGPDRWHGITLLQTVPAARRTGLGGHVMRAMAQWATQRGSSRAYLQVEERNASAVALYGKIGFATHHTYLTREAPDKP
jgi:GNAT superfamily N-acetyltransferase